MRGFVAALALAALLLAAVAAPAAAKQAPACDPFIEPQFSGTVPTSQEVIGIELGARDVTTAESDTYVRAVDAASNRVVSDSLDQRSRPGPRARLRDRRLARERPRQGPRGTSASPPHG